jgi:hypothetical protein
MFPRGMFAGDYFPDTYFPPVAEDAEAPEAGWLPQHFINRQPEADEQSDEDWFFGALT